MVGEADRVDSSGYSTGLSFIIKKGLQPSQLNQNTNLSLKITFISIFRPVSALAEPFSRTEKVNKLNF